MSAKISVIVPVYNVARFLRPCLESLLNQTFNDFEAIVVDDGSTDSSGEICDEFQKRDARVRVMHKVNGGVSSALNMGLVAATSPIIYFVDGDDWIEHNTLETINDFFNNNSDVDIFGFNNIFEKDGSSEKNVPLTAGIYENEKKDHLMMATINPRFIERKYKLKLPAIRTRWAKAFRSELVKNNKIFFAEKVTLGQDALFCTQAISLAKKIVLSNAYLYHYRVYGESNIRKYREKWDHAFYRIEGFSKIPLIETKKDFDEVKSLYCFAVVKSILLRYLNHSRNTMSKAEKYKYLQFVLSKEGFLSWSFSFEHFVYVPEYVLFLFLIKMKLVRFLVALGRFL